MEQRPEHAHGPDCGPGRKGVGECAGRGQCQPDAGHFVTSQTTLEQQIDTKASTSQLAQAVATRHPLISAEAPLPLTLVQGLQDALSAASSNATIQDGQLTIAKTSGLQSALDSRATIAALNSGLNYKQDKITSVYAIPQSHVQGPEAALASKLSSLSDAPGSSNSLIASGGTLRKLLGQDGIDVAANLTSLPDGSYASEILISGSALLQAIANLTALVNQKQTLISVANPIPSIDFVYGLGEALTNAASQVVTIDSIPNLVATLAKGGHLFSSTSRPHVFSHQGGCRAKSQPFR